ncbi:MAG: sigma-70 family RNA polymerase sigma factor, partial [Saprospiraceae bacterium]|nr:sigma-70 family RNA polymerase sigma factor [Saprospiraceae bacterium]
LNTAFMKIINSVNTYRESVPFKAWIRRIMINTAIDYYRKNRKYQEMIKYPDDEYAVETVSVDFNHADQNFDAEQLLELIRQLPPVTHQVFNLFAIDGYSHKEISKMLKMSEGTSKWHLSSARKKLQVMLNQSHSRINGLGRSGAVVKKKASI